MQIVILRGRQGRVAGGDILLGQSRTMEMGSWAIVANCATESHDLDETARLDPRDSRVPYDWTRG